MSIHDTAAKGFQQGATDYERGRPGYPVEVIDLLENQFGAGPGTVIVDLGAGTGKLTRDLVATKASVIAVEPVPAMRDVLRQVVPEAEVVDGTAESIPVPDASVDVVTAAQAFHWFDPQAAIAEVDRVLVPGGGLLLVWNLRDENVPWAAAVRQVTDRVAGPAPRYRDNGGEWRLAIEARAFTPVEELHLTNRVRTDLDTMLARVASTSYVAVLPDDERAGVLDEVAAILRAGPIAEEGPSFVEPYLTEIYWCSKL